MKYNIMATIAFVTMSAIALFMAYRLDECNLNTQPEVELLFELCGNGAPLVKDGQVYTVVCIPDGGDK
jgi:hypothetical protein